MTPGTLFFDRHFRFHDGEEGQKILIALGTAHGVTIVVKTTSQSRRFRNNFGCQADHRFPNFHLVKGCCCLSKPTWACLDEYYEFKDSELLQRHFSGDISRIGLLPDEIVIALLQCALQSEDINLRQTSIMQIALDAFRASLTE
ncbi:MAG: hypothetical protein H6974_01835 [Gammaproteobacteria bacterium]|nr:hypothetical protein [Gammaproteobacteria bacterium]